MSSPSRTPYLPRPYAAQNFHEYHSPAQGVILHPEPWEGEYNPAAQENAETFSYGEYARRSTAPLLVPGAGRNLVEQEYPRCLDMPLRLAGQESYALPSPWRKLAPLLQAIINHEHAHNPSWRDYFAYLTVDYSLVRPGEQQRHGGLHVDGFQGERITEKTKVNRSYVLTTNGGTRFYPQPFSVVDPQRFNVFQGFDLQAGEPLVAAEREAYLMDAYTVHESGLAAHEGPRLFVRLSYDVKIFDRLGNTHNSMLDYSWPMVVRNAHEQVETPTLEDVQQAPYPRHEYPTHPANHSQDAS